MTYSLCSPKLVDSVVAEIFDERLVRAAFAKVGARRYVRERIPSVRDVIEFRSNAVSLLLVWGFSFDFVPHISGRHSETVRWHRTIKSANPDLRYSGLGMLCSGPRVPGAEMIFSQGEAQFRQEAELCKKTLLNQALATLSSVSKLHDFRPLFEAETREELFFNSPQVSLAYAFYLANIGDEVQARRYMSKWLQRSPYRKETQRRLLQLFEEAAASPLVVQ